jgi:hypothetical protein
MTVTSEGSQMPFPYTATTIFSPGSHTFWVSDAFHCGQSKLPFICSSFLIPPQQLAPPSRKFAPIQPRRAGVANQRTPQRCAEPRLRALRPNDAKPATRSSHELCRRSDPRPALVHARYLMPSAITRAIQALSDASVLHWAPMPLPHKQHHCTGAHHHRGRPPPRRLGSKSTTLWRL